MTDKEKMEIELFDEFMRLCNLQVETGRHQGKGFFPDACERVLVLSLMNEMREAGLEEQHRESHFFNNWFFKCTGRIPGLENIPDALQHRTFSICIYYDKFMELRWG